MVGRLLVLSPVSILVLAACAGTRGQEPAQERTVAYMKILHEFPSGGEIQVGWLEKRERVDADGIRSTVDFVKDLDFHVRGYVSSEGRAVKYVDKSPVYEEAIGEARHYVELIPAPRDHLVRQMLDLPIDAQVKFVTARASDITK